MDLQRLDSRNVRIGAGVAAALIALIVVVIVAAGGDDADDADDADRSAAATTTTAAESSSAGAGSDSTDAPSTTGSPVSSPISVSNLPTTTQSTQSTRSTSTTGVPGSTPPATPASTTTAPPNSEVPVPVGTVEVLEPIPSNETGDFGTGLLVEVLSIDAVEATATAPGEIAGPAVSVELRLINDTDTDIDLQRVQVEVTYRPERNPGNPLSDGTERFEGVLASGGEATGTYVFGVPADQREVIQISVFYDVAAPIVVFEGPGPAA
jgi:hypothetical protein